VLCRLVASTGANSAVTASLPVRRVRSSVLSTAANAPRDISAGLSPIGNVEMQSRGERAVRRPGRS
jgi:hypothetical protein